MTHPFKVAHFGDLHIKEGDRLADQAAVLADMAMTLDVHRPDLIVIAGDIYGHTVPHRSTPAERGVLRARR